MTHAMNESAALAAKLGSEGEKLVAFMASLEEKAQRCQVYTEGSMWTVRSILAHLMTAERAFIRLFDQIRKGGPGVSEDFVIDRYNARQQEETKSLAWHELLERYGAARAEMVQFVAELTLEDLDKRGRHPFMGETSLREMIKMIYIHNQAHHRDIRRSLKPE